MIIAKRMPRIARNILFRASVQGESGSQVYLDYAEPPPKVHEYEPITVLHTDIARLEALLK